jgi:hypothetical protein
MPAWRDADSFETILVSTWVLNQHFSAENAHLARCGHLVRTHCSISIEYCLPTWSHGPEEYFRRMNGSPACSILDMVTAAGAGGTDDGCR